MDTSVQTCLARLTPHLDRRRVALTGSVAIALHLDEVGGRGHPGAERRSGDVDLVAEAVDAVLPTVAEEFLVSHFHLPQPGYAKFLVQLVDPVSRLRIDVFPDALGALPRAQWHEVTGVPLLVLDPCSILDHKLGLLAGAAARAPAEEKHYRDAQRLAALCGRLPPDLPASGFAPTAYSQELTATCPRCAASVDPRFRLAPKRQIHDLLGYV
jgi:hypothetical protein